MFQSGDITTTVKLYDSQPQRIMSWANFNISSGATPGQTLGVLLGSYALGCLASGYYLVRLVARKDVRQEGSGNIGARNVGRVLGTWALVTVLLCDLARGALAVGLTRTFTSNESLALLALLTVVIGHIWPVQLRFRGGKGVATSLGALMIFDWRIALTFCALAGVALLGLRKFTLGGLCAFAALPLVAMAWRREPVDVLGLLFLTGLVLFAHRKNLQEEIAAHTISHGQAKPEHKP